MKNIICYVIVSFCLISCGESEKSDKKEEKVDATPKIEVPIDKSSLVKIDGDVYSEYYPGNVHLKFQGNQDELGRRHGKWLYFSESGEELSMTMYENGKKHGHTIVKYPNGFLHYMGEYHNNEPSGIWKTYTINGELSETKDYGPGKN